jgi:hypothetical protein
MPAPHCVPHAVLLSYICPVVGRIYACVHTRLSTCETGVVDKQPLLLGAIYRTAVCACHNVLLGRAVGQSNVDMRWRPLPPSDLLDSNCSLRTWTLHQRKTFHHHIINSLYTPASNSLCFGLHAKTAGRSLGPRSILRIVVDSALCGVSNGVHPSLYVARLTLRARGVLAYDERRLRSLADTYRTD